MNRGEIHDRLRDFIRRDLLRNPDYPLEDDEPLITGGMIDSFELAEIGVFAETAFGVYIPDTDLTVEHMDTLRRMVERILRSG